MPVLPATLRLPPHPRLFLTPGRIGSLRAQIAPGADAVSAKLYATVRRTADAFLPLPPLRRVVTGRRLLDVSRGVIARVLHLGLVARMEDSEAHARRAVEEMLAAAEFEDWNPTHYLDTAEMTFALAVGYDWLHDHLTPDERVRVGGALLEKGLQTSLPPDAAHNHWVGGESNWTQVCHAGVATGALVVAEEAPALAASLVARAIENVPRAARAYAPDGAYAEGTMYWGYSTGFHVVLIDALTSALGHDGGLADAPGFLASARYLHQATGPTGRYFNYSDSWEERDFSVPMFWFARRLDEPTLLGADLAHLDAGRKVSDRLLPLALLWWRPEFATRRDHTMSRAPQHWRGRGPVPVGSIVRLGRTGRRCSWRLRAVVPPRPMDTWTAARSCWRPAGCAGRRISGCRTTTVWSRAVSTCGMAARTATAGGCSASAGSRTTSCASTTRRKFCVRGYRWCASRTRAHGRTPSWT